MGLLLCSLIAAHLSASLPPSRHALLGVDIFNIAVCSDDEALVAGLQQLQAQFERNGSGVRLSIVRLCAKWGPFAGCMQVIKMAHLSIEV